MCSTLLRLTIVTALVVLFISCDSENEAQRARLEVWLTDGPGDFEEVNVDLAGVEIHAAENENQGPWMELDAREGVINLLEFTNGFDTLIASDEIPSGKISQIRLVLGENNTVKVAGNFYDLTIPSGATSGLKLQVHETLNEGVVYKILLDFDVARSVVQAGTGAYLLKPVVRVITEAETGAIKGIVDPAAATPAIYALAGDDTVATTYSDANGRFLLRGVPEGDYRVTFEPNEDFEKRQTDVSVTTGEVTDVGTVSFSEVSD